MGKKTTNMDVNSGKLETENYKFVVEEIFKQYPKLKYLAITLSGLISANFNTWSAVLFNGTNLYIEP